MVRYSFATGVAPSGLHELGVGHDLDERRTLVGQRPAEGVVQLPGRLDPDSEHHADLIEESKRSVLERNQQLETAISRTLYLQL